MSKHRSKSLRVLRPSMLLVFLSFIGGLTYGQEKPPDAARRRPLSPEAANGSAERLQPPLSSPKEPVNCAVAGRYIDDAIARMARAENSFFIAIIRQGDGESPSALHRKRLMQVKAYLEYTHLPNYIVAIGEKLEGAGRLEIYVEGKLLYTLPLHKNRGINLLSCVAV